MIYLASDHAGFELKEKLKIYLQELGYEVRDFGAFQYDADDDYPDFIRQAAEAVSKNPEKDRAIILGGSGQGEAMVANRFKGVRAVVYYGFFPAPKSYEVEPHKISDKADSEQNNKIIRFSREHNNANVLSLGARFLTEEEAKRAVKLWLDTKFNNEERHVRRIKKIDN